MGLTNEEAEEVFKKACDAEAIIHGLLKADNELDYDDLGEAIYELEIIQRRTDPAQWKEYDYDEC